MFLRGRLHEDVQNSNAKGMYFKYIGTFFQGNLDFRIKSKESKQRMSARPVRGKKNKQTSHERIKILSNNSVFCTMTIREIKFNRVQ